MSVYFTVGGVSQLTPIHSANIWFLFYYQRVELEIQDYASTANLNSGDECVQLFLKLPKKNK